MVSARRKIAEGAEAELYAARVLGMQSVLKQRIPKAYRIPELDSRIREQRTKSEARALATASACGANVPPIFMVTKYGIYMGTVPGVRLSKVLSAGNAKSAEKKMLLNAGRQLAMIHGAGLVHGDYTPANMIADAKGNIAIIDFGLAQVDSSSEGRALDLLLLKRSVGRQLYGSFVRGYCSAAKGSSAVLNRLAEIERRGRYQTRTLMTG